MAKSEFHVKANLGFVVRGPLLSLQLVMDELQRFVASKPDLDLIFSHVSANKVYLTDKEDMRL